MRLSAVALGLVLIAGLLEAGLRIFEPAMVRRIGVEQRIGEKSPFHPRRRIMELDGENGYRPVLGGTTYDERGTLPNDYPLARTEGVRRLLFLGDSVTKRGRIVEGFRTVFGEDGFEYWNAGVEAYATAQEVSYYRRFLEPLGEDHVILTFHMNDFLTTPISFFDPEKGLVFLEPNLAVRELSPWLLRHCYLYRAWISMRSGLTEDTKSKAGVEEDIAASLHELADLTRARGSRLTVLVFPLLFPFESWRPVQQKRHAKVLGILQAAGIETYDLVPPMEAALAESLDIWQEKGDVYHPNELFGERCVRYLVESGFRP